MTDHMRTIIFRREGMFYSTEYPATYSDWQAEADRNPGTLRIETIDGATLWPVLASVTADQSEPGSKGLGFVLDREVTVHSPAPIPPVDTPSNDDFPRIQVIGSINE